MENEAKREFMDLTVNELSVVDSPANEEEFIVIKCKNQEGLDMADENKEVTKEAGPPAAEGNTTPKETGANVERVAVDVEKAEDAAVVEAMGKVQATIEGIAKQLGVQANDTADEKPTPREIVEKQLKAAGLGDEAVKKSLEEYDAAAGTPEAEVEKGCKPGSKMKAEGGEDAEEAKTEKAEGDAPAETPVEKSEDDALDVLSQLETAIAKAKRFTPQREETLKNAVEQLQKLLAALQPQAPKSVTTPKNNLPSNVSAGEAMLTNVSKALADLTETIQKSMGAIQEGQKELATRVEDIEKARQPSKAVGEDGTDGVELVDTKKNKSIWGGIL
jgi:hypothetical protein